MLTSRAGDVQAIGQRLQKKLPYGGRAERTRAFKKANLAMTVLCSRPPQLVLCSSLQRHIAKRIFALSNFFSFLMFPLAKKPE